ncbi:protein arginine N-methyltransferase 9-like [Cylas formicarius]|uniref:protein arginine N-methyltransferase 9-like n=1 Tax=Cylas formicarius TaxID=197179 RepID=UPI0029587D9D|nr:protein arginine N-methyltransferase 9-like [Cylas formicarius]
MLCSSESRVPLILSNLSLKSCKMSSGFYLRKAKQNCADNNYPEAYKNFVNYFESLSDPSEATAAVQLAFTKLVCKIGVVLEDADNTEELFKVYLQALNFFPNNYVILNNLGAYLFKIGETNIARRYLDMAVNCSKNYLPAQKNLMQCKWEQMPRWHFKMLNDKNRNMAYYKAVTNVIDKGFTNVIDVGAGCGLLSLFASQNSEVNVIAIEENKFLAKMCEDVLKENERVNVKVLNCNSTKLTEPYGSCNLIVTEIFDVALFGERMLESLIHAHQVLVTEKSFKIIPCAARLFAMGIDYRSLQNFRYVNKIAELNLTDICIRQVDPDPYEAEDLSVKDVEYISEAAKIFDIDFYDVGQLNDMLTNKNFSTIIKIRCLKDGQLTALAVWFELDLDENITITTNPLSKDRILCWEQAVFHLPHTISVKTGEVIQFEVTVFDSQLKFYQITKPDVCVSCWLVTKDIITFLNDDLVVRKFIELSMKFTDTVPVMDLNCFPLFGFLMAKRGSKFYTALKHDNSMQNIDFFDHVLKTNDVKGQMIVLEEKLTCNTAMCVVFEYLTKCQFCLIDPISSDGSLQQSILFKEKNAPLFNTIMLPKTLKVNAILINSWYLEYWNMVKDENVFDFKIAQYVNQYMGTEHPNLDNFEYTKYSEPITFLIDEKNLTKSEFITVTKDGQVNGLLTWFDIIFYEDVTFSSLDSFHFKRSCYIFEPQLVTDGNTYKVSMRREGSYLDILFNVP